jgi:hypothetical protein
MPISEKPKETILFNEQPSLILIQYPEELKVKFS